MALTADHGEEFLDHGGRYHPPSSVAEELVRVPLLLHGPGLPQATKVAAPFSLTASGADAAGSGGVSRFPAAFGDAATPSLLKNGGAWESDAIIECIAGCTNPFVAENRLQARVLAVREARYKMVFDFTSAGEQLYDLQADPGELRPCR